MHSGYGTASLSERLYAWPEAEDRPAAAGLLITTTASDSDGTLGGLVALSEPSRLADVLDAALRGLMRCSSDPVCARRVPEDPEDFLHGATCHCCVMASRPPASGPIVSSTAVSSCHCPASGPGSPSSGTPVGESAGRRTIELGLRLDEPLLARSVEDRLRVLEPSVYERSVTGQDA
ncbi:hypothetical protein [Propionibacterium acidifaciens]|uniref:hypothetical protein n=1 Tax=Propionibacterium acidifaciens TaxID=556499 RepID=UPI0028DB3DE1|nr:hypothetical protein [Propionibacterium acidifaciens]